MATLSLPSSMFSYSTPRQLDSVSGAQYERDQANTTGLNCESTGSAPNRPKSSKPDAKLTQFIPTALRVKRGTPASLSQVSKVAKIAIGETSSKVGTTFSSSSTVNASNPMVTSQVPIPQPVVSIPVDDAYKAFLAEIEALGGI